MQSLNIQIQTIELGKNVVQDNDTIRVSVTTLPGEQKQAFTFEAKKLKTVMPFFSVKIDDKTKKILIVMRKKSFSQKDPIICSTVIEGEELPKKINDDKNTERKTIKLLEPLQQAGKKNKNRKTLGEMEVQFSLTQELFYESNIHQQINKKHNGKGYSKMESFFGSENDNNNFLLNELITN
ncbi:hypothetical protein M9Y10_006380 [Tritrichomonas musculus]|uniref:Uncharacterized protein n=1 Tax=Tritrichomonas musculus TaxID=1915356 RepID=A0ABR2JF60_9EUKA